MAFIKSNFGWNFKIDVLPRETPLLTVITSVPSGSKPAAAPPFIIMIYMQIVTLLNDSSWFFLKELVDLYNLMYNLCQSSRPIIILLPLLDYYSQFSFSYLTNHIFWGFLHSGGNFSRR